MSACASPASAPDPPASAPPSSSSGPATASELAGVLLDDLLVEERPGYAGLTIDEDADTLNLYWVGSVPDDVDAAITASDVAASVESRAFDQKELLAATSTIFDHLEDLRDSGIELHEAGPAPDGSVVLVGIGITGETTLTQAAIEISELTELPVRVALTEEIVPL